MFERLTEGARKLVTNAQNVSASMGHGYVGTEHLLLGTLQDSDSRATTTLRAKGVDFDAVMLLLAEHFSNVTSSAAPTAHTPFTVRAKKVLEVALMESLRVGTGYIEPEHIVLAMLRDEECEASKVLGRCKIDYTIFLVQLTALEEPVPAVDGRVRIVREGNIVTITIRADASVDLVGFAFGGESYALVSGDEHIVTITLKE